MALDSKLRLQIVTALDNAGIKATEDQINGLASKIQNINKEAAGSKIQNALGDIPGKLGKIAKGLSGMPAQIALIVGAFQTGWEIGTKFFNTVIKGWFGWEDAVTKLKKANRALNKELESNASTFDRLTQRRLTQHDQEISKIDSIIKKLNAEAQAYLRLGKAQSEFTMAGEDQDIQRLERERFEDMVALQSSGDYDAAEQVSKVYDIYRQELEAKKQLFKYDEDSAAFAAERAAKEQEAFKWVEKVDKLKKQREYWVERRDYLNGDFSVKPADYDKLMKPIESKIASIDRQLTDADTQAEKYMADIDAADYEALTRERNRSTLVDKLTLDRDKLLWQAEQAINADGNRYGWNFNDDWIQQNYNTSIQSYRELQDIKTNTENLAQKLDDLLGLKQ